MTASLTFRDLLHLAFPRPALQWLAGKEAAKVPVGWVAMAVEEIQPGDAVVLPASFATIETLQAADRHGASGILLLGTCPEFNETELTGVPLAALEGEEDGRAVQRLLLTLLVNQRAGLVERGYRIHLQLAQLSAEGAGLVGLVKAVVDITGRGALVQDKRGYILAEQTSPELSGIWQDVLAQLNEITSLPESLRDRKLAGKQGGEVMQEIPGGLARLACPITVGGVARGYLSLVGLSGEMDELDYLVAEQGVVVCAIEMARSKAMREMEKRLQGDLLTALLHEDLPPRDAALWAQTMGLDLAQAHVAMRFAWAKPDAPSRRRLETMVNGEVNRLGVKVIVSAMGAEVICFCQVIPMQSRPEVALELGQAVLDQSQQEYPDFPAYCGIGLEALDLSDWRTSFRQAGQALEMARRLEADKVMFFPDLSIYRLLLQIEHNPELAAFQEETLGALLALENNQELVRTLESYFAHNGNISQTADALFIHRNTLIYRLERIGSILSQDLDNPETRLALQLALHIHRMGMGRT